MNISILTLFPEMFNALNHSIIGKAVEQNLLKISVHNIRDYSTDKHKKCDDYPFGGGAGMLMSAQPIYDCIKAVDPQHKSLRVYMSPKGSLMTQQCVKKLAQVDDILILCGHYEGIDERIIELCIDQQVSVGDYICSGGELPAMVLVDCVARYCDGVLGSNESVDEESFENNLLEYPQYTRPQVFEGLAVPEVLISGNHKLIKEWRHAKQLEITEQVRPDLLKK